MPNLDLPPKHLEGLKLLAEMDDAQYSHFSQTIGNEKQFTDRVHLISQVAASAPESLKDAYSKIASTAVAMMSFCAYAEVPTNVFAQDVFDSTGVKNLKLEDKEKVAKARLLQLLSTGSVIVAAKATANLTAHEHPFRSVRIFTDVRTVFIDEEQSENVTPAAAVIVQMMRIRYIKNGNQEEIFFALDTIDIDSMISTLQRAKSKQEKLKSLLAKTSLPCVEMISDDEE